MAFFIRYLAFPFLALAVADSSSYASGAARLVCTPIVSLGANLAKGKKFVSGELEINTFQFEERTGGQVSEIIDGKVYKLSCRDNKIDGLIWRACFNGVATYFGIEFTNLFYTRAILWPDGGVSLLHGRCELSR